ncbi:ferritin-like domain-containing protein [Alteribacter natronophilus]|uniref:ferritin-like domain-containing protein n=1 Tax=Alteribacter natronophilus TaxID=2583810 RepID=UPI00110EB45E|nr:ferritin-like domain-containing protein [Alteribacter natronophilus]TMW70328.1 ferritin-like domain-containing protein [Alteribacter natronophilus]
MNNDIPQLAFGINREMIRNIARSIDNEYTAVICYEGLMQMAPDEYSAYRIMRIREDNMRHYQAFSQIFTMVTGHQHQPQMTRECPQDFREGSRAAFIDEQENVEFYLRIAEEADIPFVRRSYRRASSDDQNSATWFLYFLTL